MPLSGILVLIVAYLVGGIPFGLLYARFTAGRDIRKEGSGNIGATNALRTLGRTAFAVTLLLDIGKGVFAVWLADLASQGNILWMSLAALAVIFGHAFSIWLRFTGGKSVASFIGAFLYLTPVPLLACAFVLVVLLAVTRYMSLASIIAVGSLPLACWLILQGPWPVLLASGISAVLVIGRHRGNIQRLRAGTENVFSLRKKK
jgi:acyl phosphate:glycerol-3-phosphate acyltransferase